MIKNAFLFFSLILTALWTQFSVATERQMACWVVGVSDGDTLTCLLPTKNNSKCDYKKLMHRKKANHLEESQTISFTTGFQTNVTLSVSGYDRYQRILATVYLQEQNINLEMVKTAWRGFIRNMLKIHSTFRHKILPNNKKLAYGEIPTLLPLMNGENRTKQANMEVNMAFDYQSFKNEFPYFKSSNAVVYLDNAATTLKPQALIDATSTFYQSAGSVHRSQYEAAQTAQYENARHLVKTLINAEDEKR